MTKLWERQPWDTKTSFDRFQRFYLPQENPRSPTEAYRAWRLSQGREWAGKYIPGTWTAWAAGRHPKTGKIPPGAVSWAERAAAYDDHLAAKDRDKWEKRRAEYRERVQAILESGLARLEDMLAYPLIQTRDEQGITVVEPVKWDIKAAAQLARSLQSLAVGLGFEDQPEQPANQTNINLEQRIDVANLSTEQLEAIVRTSDQPDDPGRQPGAGQT